MSGQTLSGGGETLMSEPVNIRHLPYEYHCQKVRRTIPGHRRSLTWGLAGGGQGRMIRSTGRRKSTATKRTLRSNIQGKRNSRSKGSEAGMYSACLISRRKRIAEEFGSIGQG